MNMNGKEKNLVGLLEEVEKRDKRNEGNRKTLADIYGKLKRGLDGLEYQKIVRNGEWN